MKHRYCMNVLLVLIGICLISGCDDKKPAEEQPVRPVKLFSVGKAELANYHMYPAKVRASKRVKLSFQVPGKLVEFPVKTGTFVKKGQLLAALDPRDYENKLNVATATYNCDSSEFSRYSKLVKTNSISVAAYEDKRRAYEVSKATMEIAKKGLSDTRLTAPFDGAVAFTYVDNYQDVQAKQEILSLQATDKIELVINIPEKDIIKFSGPASLDRITKMSSPVAIFDGLDGRSFPLQISEFETEADPATQTFRGVLTMDNPGDCRIMPGMTAMVRMATSWDKNSNAPRYWIPSVAVNQDNNGRTYVWTVDDKMTVKKHEVSVEEMNKDQIKVIEGLKENDVVVTSGMKFLTDGMKVKELTQIGDYKYNN